MSEKKKVRKQIERKEERWKANEKFAQSKQQQSQNTDQQKR